MKVGKKIKKQIDRKKIYAIFLLSLYTSILLISSLHVHHCPTSSPEPILSNNSNVVSIHQGHDSCSRCLLCEFLQESYVAGGAIIIFYTLIKHYSYKLRITSLPCRIMYAPTTRGPPIL